MTKKNIEFWYAIGSTYTYLTVMRIGKVCKKAGVSLTWHPFNIRQIMSESNNIPFPATKPDKVAYMWRDLQRQAIKHGLPIKMPVDYPLEHFDRANKVAILASHEGWCAEYTMSAYQSWFQDGLPAGTPENLERCFKGPGRSLDNVLLRCEHDDINKSYAHNTDEARTRGIFGAPSFYTGGELFWGDDRLEDAVAWARKVV